MNYSKYRRYQLYDNVYGLRNEAKQFKGPLIAGMKLLAKNCGLNSGISDIWVFDNKEQRVIARIAIQDQSWKLLSA